MRVINTFRTLIHGKSLIFKNYFALSNCIYIYKKKKTIEVA